MKLWAFGFNQTNPAATDLSSPSSDETLPRSSYEAEKFTESPQLHKTSKKQEDTSDSKPQSDEGQPQQASTNPESNTGSDSAPGISQMKLCSQFRCFVDYFFGIRSKRPQVKTSPNWSKRPQLQLQIGQNGPKNGPKNGLKFDLGFK